jgi:death-on-curing protein
VIHLDLDDVIDVAGGRHLVRDTGLLASAVARPQATLLGRDAYPDIWCKAAALGESIARNYALIDRNKRTAFECMLLFLDFNDEPYTDPSPDEAVSFMLSLATGGFEKDGIEKAASHLRRILGR